jgi:hypothetical protein
MSAQTLSIAKGEVKGKHTLAAPGDELAAVLDELARHLEEFLGLVHCGGFVCVVCRVFEWCVREVGGFSLLVWFGGNRYCGCVVFVWCRILRVKFNCGGSCAAVEGQLACWSSRRTRKAGVRVWPPVLNKPPFVKAACLK